ncbi:MAG: lysine 2,3-aminomutase, partial [Desulfuromonadales bacterium]|nr:lysine 2,3-aminomutase [Desulfuromonadales bacterium]NIS42767.1 lysine 2,3-aminomutase [Desulfuromonadales bacterium]
MPIYSKNQQEIAEKISEKDASLSNWKDWKWQLKNSVQDIDTFESLLGISFSEEERKKL